MNHSAELSALRLTVLSIVRRLCFTWSGQESSTLPRRRSLAPYCESNVMYKETALIAVFLCLQFEASRLGCSGCDTFGTFAGPENTKPLKFARKIRGLCLFQLVEPGGFESQTSISRPNQGFSALCKKP